MDHNRHETDQHRTHHEDKNRLRRFIDHVVNPPDPRPPSDRTIPELAALIDTEARDFINQMRTGTEQERENARNALSTKIRNDATNFWNNRDQEGITDWTTHLSRFRSLPNEINPGRWHRGRLVGATLKAIESYCDDLRKRIERAPLKKNSVNDQATLNEVREYVHMIRRNAQFEVIENALQRPLQPNHTDQRNESLRRLGVYYHMLWKTDRALYSFLDENNLSKANWHIHWSEGIKSVQSAEDRKPVSSEPSDITGPSTLPHPDKTPTSPESRPLLGKEIKGIIDHILTMQDTQDTQNIQSDIENAEITLRLKVQDRADDRWKNRDQKGIIDIVTELNSLRDSNQWNRARYVNAVKNAIERYYNQLKQRIDSALDPDSTNDEKSILKLKRADKYLEVIRRNAQFEVDCNALGPSKTTAQKNGSLRRLGVYYHMLKEIDSALYSQLQHDDRTGAYWTSETPEERITILEDQWRRRNFEGHWTAALTEAPVIENPSPTFSQRMADLDQQNLADRLRFVKRLLQRWPSF